MNLLVKILIVLFFLVAVLLIVALFLKNDYQIEKEIVINKPKSEVYNYVKYLKNQDHYSKWVMTDPAMKKTFSGTDGTEGFIYAWDSKNKDAGKGEQELKRLIEGELVDIEVRFEKPFEGIAYTPIETETVSGDQTKVTWGMKGRNKYPMSLLNGFIGNMLGKDLEQSLTTLKNILEKEGKPQPVL